MKVLVIGAGKMTSAILEGFKGQEDLSQWEIFSPTGVSAKKLAESVGAKWREDLNHLEGFDYVLLGCKPQQLGDFGKDHGDKIKAFPVLSMLAAISEEDQRAHLKVSKLVRIMPNMPVKFRKGVTLIASSSASESLTHIQVLFQKIGNAYGMKESELEELTLLSGSGPAFFYEFSKNLADSFSSLSSNEREEISRAVLLGSGLMSSVEKKDLNTLIGEVTSKGGVTIAVLEKFRELDLKDLVLKGMQNGVKRTQELKELLRRK